MSIQQVYDNHRGIQYKNFYIESLSDTNMNTKLKMSGCTIADIYERAFRTGQLLKIYP